MIMSSFQKCEHEQQGTGVKKIKTIGPSVHMHSLVCRMLSLLASSSICYLHRLSICACVRTCVRACACSFVTLATRVLSLALLLTLFGRSYFFFARSFFCSFVGTLAHTFIHPAISVSADLLFQETHFQVWPMLCWKT